MNAIEEVKARLDIVEVIGQYVQLAKAGRNFKALCPFHTERTPSFFVSPERQSWHCFGACGTGGDVVSFVMRKEGLEFGQALRLLAEKAGVVLPERREEAEDKAGERLRQANEAAAQYFHQLLLNSEGGKVAREYLERRGIDVQTAREFSLGYSPAGWEALRQYLGERGFGPEELLAAGLLVEGEAGLYDRFRNRLMFPIRDVKGRTIGFGARALPPEAHSPSARDDSLPKYLNTPQTAAFDKGSTLYALERARDGIRKEGRAVIVEGYMDAIAAHEHGFTNVVASMGTSLTERQVRLLKRYTRNLVLALDADAAGSEAALRGQEVVEGALRDTSGQEVVPVLTWRGLVRYQESVVLDLRVAELPAGRDPDDVIRGEPKEWRRLVEGAKPVLDYKFEAVTLRTDVSDPRARSQAVQDLLPVVGAIADPVVRAHYLQRLSRLALVREEELASMLARPRERGRAAKETSPALAPASRGDAREEFLLALLLRYPSLRQQGLALSQELLWQAENREILAAWRRTADIESLREELPEELRGHLERLLARRLPVSDERSAGAALADCQRGLERRKLKLEKQASAAELAAQEAEVGPTPLAEAAIILWRGEQALADERRAQAAGLQVQDLEAGLRLHRGAIEVGKEGTEEGLSAGRAEVEVDE